jgi:hypothetical protein
MTTPAYRYLRGFALDPGFSTRLATAGINEVVYRIPFESVEPGPVGEYIEVMDIDPATGCWYEPVDLRDETVASQQGLTPSEGNPQFHQQFVYTVAMKTIGHFERALGRKIIWVQQKRAGDDGGGYAYVQRLRIHPHALRDANAYYDTERVALLFGYFSAADQLVGANYPGGLVFTCLSPDIVAHEMTHGILDSIHHRYMEDTNPDVGAFHEGFADIVGLLQRFTFRSLVEHQLSQSGGRLDRYTVLGELATQFGEALAGYRGALRSAIGEWTERGWQPKVPKATDYITILEPHDRGALLVATVFDAFLRVYQFRTADLFRIAEALGGAIPADIITRLGREASVIAEHLLHICIRALDYCPPTDITFGDYLRALVTADMDIAPEDETGYRLALIEAFRARGIFPHNVNILSPESLRWTSVELSPGRRDFFATSMQDLKPLIRNIVGEQKRAAIAEQSRQMQVIWHDALEHKLDRKDPEAREDFLQLLGLTGKNVEDLFADGSAKTLKFIDARGKPFRNAPPPIEVHAIRPVFRAGREGKQIEQVLVSVTQTVRVNFGTQTNPDVMIFRGGGTLIMPLDDLTRIDYAITKNMRSKERFDRQRKYMTTGGDESLSARSTYDGPEHALRLDLKQLHRH